MTKPTATISLDEVRKVAQLARLDVQEDELARLQAQLENILNYMSELNDVDVSALEPSCHSISLQAPLREDEPHLVPIPREAFLSQAPALADHGFKVPKVLENT